MMPPGVLRELLRIESRNGRPGTLLTLRSGEGRHLYLEAAMPPLSIVLALERDDVLNLVSACSLWLDERDQDYAGPRSAPAPLVAGVIGRTRIDADGGRVTGYLSPGTVQVRTVPEP